MPRDLGDVFHHLVPEAAPARRAAPPFRVERAEPGAARLPGAPPLVHAVPIGRRGTLHAAFVWNLAVELAGRGIESGVVTPIDTDPAGLWPVLGADGLGAGVALARATGSEELGRAVRAYTSSFDGGGVVFARVPLGWLSKAADAGPLLRRVLLFASPERRDLLRAYVLARLVAGVAPGARLGVVIHGARSVGEARAAFERLAGAARRFLSATVTSYGLLAGDRHVLESASEGVAIARARPGTPAARALADVAGWIAADAEAQG